MKIVSSFKPLNAFLLILVFVVSSAFYVSDSKTNTQTVAYSLADVQKVYPEAKFFKLTNEKLIEVKDSKKKLIGFLLSSTDFNISYTGYSGDVSMLIALDKKHIIKGVSIFAHKEDQHYINHAVVAGLLDKWTSKAMVAATVNEPIDAVSGATYSSTAIINTVRHSIAAFIKVNVPTPIQISLNLSEKTSIIQHENSAINTKKSLGPRAAIMPKPALVIGSYDKNGVPNIMTVGWAGIANSKPLSVAISIRPACKSHDNIMYSRFFTINVPSAKYAAHMDYVGVVSGHNENKFETLGLTPVKGEFVNAPYVAEFPVVLECEVTQTFNLGSHTQFIGKVLDTKVDSNLLDAKNNIDALKMQPVIFDQSGYFTYGKFLGKPFDLYKTLQAQNPQNATSAPKQNETLQTIFNRKSVRHYTNQKVSKEQLKLLVRAGMAAPSARNKQPWTFVIITERTVLDSLAEKLPNAKMLRYATAAIAVCGDMTKTFEGEAKSYWVQDCSAATQNILLAAESMELGAVWTGVYPIAERQQYVKKILQLPAHITPLNVIAIGYPQGDEQPKNKWNEDLIRWEKW